MHHHTSPHTRRCIDVCNDCAAVCLQTARHCLSMGEDHAAPDHQTLLHDCADICATAARFMARGSAHHTHICRECAEICHQCARECDAMAEGDQQMEDCADHCRRCANECARMAGAYA